MEMASSERPDGATRLRLTGRLDFAGTAEIEPRFLATMSSTGTKILVDLSGLSFIGSSGIRMLIDAVREAHRLGRATALFGARAFVRETLDSVALSDLVPIADNEEAAAQLIGCASSRP